MSDDAFTWSCADASGRVLDVDVPRFPTQGEAEAWFAEAWEQVKDAGADAVTLVQGDQVVYGPMSLQAMGE